MTKLRYDQLEKSLASKNTPLAPVYLVTGDEPLLVQEACDTIRQTARQRDFLERELHHTDAGFSWDSLTHSANSISLFAEKKIIEIRVHNGKPGDAGSKALVEYCQSPSEDNLLLLEFPKLDKRTQNSKWFKAYFDQNKSSINVKIPWGTKLKEFDCNSWLKIKVHILMRYL